MTLESVSRNDFSNYATGVSRMVTALNDRAADTVNEIHSSFPKKMEPRSLGLDGVVSAMGMFDQISLGIEQAAASNSQAAAAYQAQA